MGELTPGSGCGALATLGCRRLLGLQFYPVAPELPSCFRVGTDVIKVPPIHLNDCDRRNVLGIDRQQSALLSQLSQFNERKAQSFLGITFATLVAPNEKTDVASMKDRKSTRLNSSHRV